METGIRIHTRTGGIVHKRSLPHQTSVPLSMILHLTERFNLYMIVKPLPNYYVSHHIHFKHIVPFTAHFTGANLFYVILLYNLILYCPTSFWFILESSRINFEKSIGLHTRTPRTYNPMHQTCNISSRTKSIKVAGKPRSLFRRETKKRQT
jgi:hypothetical protein